MKTILHILAILLVAVAVAGTMYLIINNTSAGASLTGGEGDRPAFTDASGQPLPRPEGDLGDREGGASLGGLLGLFGTLAKVSALTAIVLLIEKGIMSLKNRVLRTTPA